jgi:hypothetical protein
MQLLFKTSLLNSKIPVFYTIYKKSDNSYLAQTSASGMNAFVFSKKSGQWVSNDGAYALQAKQIGNLMDKHYREHIQVLEASK